MEEDKKLGLAIKPKISVCIIVKNEETYFRQCLESLKDVAYEIIIVDTGSTDGTKEIALSPLSPLKDSLPGLSEKSKNDKKIALKPNDLRRGNPLRLPFSDSPPFRTPPPGVKVYETNWENDFSKARNESIKYATGDWILIIDADEELTEETKNLLPEFLAQYNDKPGPLAFNFKFIEPQPDNSNMTVTYYKNTLFRNGFDIYFKNPVHEKLFSSANNIVFTDCSFLTIKHNGNYKSKESRYKKLETYKKILLDEITRDETNPENSYYYYYLGTTLSLQGNFDEAINYLIEASEISTDKNGTLYCNTLRNLISVYLQKKEYEEALKYTVLLLELVSFFIDANFYLAYSKQQLNMISEAIEVYENILSETEKYLISVEGLVSYGESIVPEVFSELGTCYLLQGEFLKAENILYEGLKKYENYQVLLKKLFLTNLLKLDLQTALKFYYLISEADISTRIQDANILSLGTEHWMYKSKVVKMLQYLSMEPEFSVSENNIIKQKIKELSPKLSVCMIVKNEEEFIRDTLESTFDLAYEIIILDTGSTDRTREIVLSPPAPLAEKEGRWTLQVGDVQKVKNDKKTALKPNDLRSGNPLRLPFSDSSPFRTPPDLGVRLYETTWEDDFSKARNECAEYATGDWILRIDGDEKLTEKTRLLLLPFLAEQNPDLPLVFNFKIIEPQIIEGQKIYNTYYKNILYRNKSGIHFKKPRHEYISSDKHKLITRDCSFLEIYHSANLKKNLKGKSEENIIKMLEQVNNAESIQEKYFYYYFIGNSYNMLEDYDNSLMYYGKSLEILERTDDLTYKIYVLRNMIITLLFYKKDYIRSLERTEQLMKIVPNHPDLYYYYGYALQRLGNNPEASEYYEKALKIIEQKPENSENFFCDLHDLKKRVLQEINSLI